LVIVIAIAAVALAVARGRPFGVERWDTNEARSVQVEAQEYHLLDPDGNLRGLRRCPPAGPTLTLLDEHGRLIIELWQHNQGGAVRVLDATGHPIFEQPAR